jgi:hypothetical protein
MICVYESQPVGLAAVAAGADQSDFTRVREKMTGVTWTRGRVRMTGVTLHGTVKN